MSIQTTNAMRDEMMASSTMSNARSKRGAALTAMVILALTASPWAAVRAAEQAAPEVAGGAWVPRGPAPATNGQPENIPDKPITGAIESVAAHPTNPDILWIASVNGGIFRTDNATDANPVWTQQTDSQASLSTATLELDPTDPSHNTLVAGIGRTSSFAGRGGARTGVLRTTDGGATWTLLPSMAGRDIGGGVAARGSVIVAAVEGSDLGTLCSELGIFRSTDGGATFTQISDNPGVTGMPCGFSWDLASDPTDTTRLFAPATGTGGPTDGIYRSTDTGATWTKVSNAAMDALLSAAPPNVHLAVGTAGGASANVYAAICNGAGQLAGLFRSGDAGGSWTTLDLPTTTEMGTPYGIHVGHQCGTHLSLVADPTNHDVVYIGGDRQPANNENGGPGPQWPNSIEASDYGGRLFRVDASQAPGSQATPMTNCPAATAACGGAVRTVNDTAPHADSRDMVFDANGDLVQTDDGGIYKHTDPSGSSGDWVSVIGNLPVNEQHDGDFDAISSILISGNQDNGTTSQIATSSDVWTSVLGGDGGDVAVGENDPPGQSTRYMSAQNFFIPRRRVYDAANVQQSITIPSLTPLGGDPAPTGQFVTPLGINAVAPMRVILGAANGTYESADRLDSVSRISTATVNSDGRGPIAYGAAANADVLYFGSGDQVYVRTAAPPAAPVANDPDGGSTDAITGLTIDPSDPTAVFAVDRNQVFWSSNSGSSWTDVTGNLLSFGPGKLGSIEYVPNGVSGDALVVGADVGVFRSLAPSFDTWDRLGTLPNAPIYDLDYGAAADVLAAATLGRGAWTLDSASLQVHNLCNQSLDLVTGQWRQISLACDPGGSNTVADVLGDDLTGTYGTNWVVYRYDAASQSNVALTLGSTLAVGEAYWIKTNQAAQTIDTGSTVNAVTDVALVASAADPPEGCANSAGRCNMVGTPHSYDVCWADVQVVDGASVLSLAEADPAGACQGADAATNGCVMSRIAHKWTGSSYAAFDGQTPGMEGTVVPWDGLWVSAVKSGIELRIPDVAGGPGLPCGDPAAADPASWYVRLIAESGAMRDAANVFGQLTDSVDGYDAHDLPELPPFGEPYLTVAFPHDDWDGNAGDYASDYHSWRGEEKPDWWRFEVRASDPAATVTLSWEGPVDRLLESVLTDLDSGVQVRPGIDGSYTFTMNGPSRSFRWATGPVIFEDGFESGDTSAWSSTIGAQ